jgi:hypothetical protein
MHPYEDWAETFAHYLHIRDTAQTAVAYGSASRAPRRRAAPPPRPRAGLRAARAAPGDAGAARDWLPLTYALNALNRSMGADDLYPFVLTEPVIEKLELIDELVLARAAA